MMNWLVTVIGWLVMLTSTCFALVIEWNAGYHFQVVLAAISVVYAFGRLNKYLGDQAEYATRSANRAWENGRSAGQRESKRAN